MKKINLVRIVGRETGFTVREATAVINTFLEEVREAIKQGRTLEIRGFGTFKIKIKKAKTARNVKKNTTVQIPERAAPAFKFSRSFTTEIMEMGK